MIADNSKFRATTKLLTTVFVLLIVQTILRAQTGFPEGTYRVDVARSEALMTEGIKIKYDSLSTELRARVRDNMRDRIFNFQKDGIVEVKWQAGGSEKSVTGTAEFHPEKSELVIKINGTETIFQIASPASNAIILRNPKGSGFLNNLYLIKAD